MSNNSSFAPGLTFKNHSTKVSPCGIAGAIVALILSSAYFHLIFPTYDFITGRATFLATQQQDVTQYLTGVTAFRHEPWSWPLLSVRSINWPNGTYVTFLDAIPLLALLAKLFDPLFPQNPLGLWVYACFLLMGLSTWWAVRRSLTKWPSMILAIALAIQMPALLMRLGHLSLMAHFLIVLAFGLYLRAVQRDDDRPGLWALLIFCSFYINIYITAMVLAMFTATVIDRVMKTNTSHCGQLWCYALSLVPVVVSLPIAFGTSFGTSLTETGFNFYSMNVLSPVIGGAIIQFPWFQNGTLGQYEGYNYLGLGVILGALTCLVGAYNSKPDRLLGPAMIALCAALFVYSLSNDIHVSQWLFIHWDVPKFLAPITETFRVPGRFFWPVSYILVFCISIHLDRRGWREATILATAILALQWFDLTGVRAQGSALARRDSEILANPEKWKEALDGVKLIRFFPKFHCGGDPTRELLPIQAIAASNQIRIDTGYISRYSPDNCEIVALNDDPDVTAFVFAPSAADLNQAQLIVPSELSCSSLDNWVLCR